MEQADGKMWHITLPSILPVVSIMFILSLGGILNAGFDQIFNLYSPAVYEVADVIDTYVYRAGIQQAQFVNDGRRIIQERHRHHAGAGHQLRHEENGTGRRPLMRTRRR